MNAVLMRVVVHPQLFLQCSVCEDDDLEAREDGVGERVLLEDVDGDIAVELPYAWQCCLVSLLPNV